MKLNLGCGDHIIPGWVNADNDPDKNPDVVADALCLPWEDNYFSQVLLCHTLEHFELYDVPKVLNEVRRVLAPGGQVLVICPDIQSLVNRYVNATQNRWNPSEPDMWTGHSPPPHQDEATISSVLLALFGWLVLEDDRDAPKPDKNGHTLLQNLPHTDHRWNTYGARLMDRMSEVFDNLELLTTNGIEGLWLGHVEDKVDDRGHGQLSVWTDLRNDRKWETTGFYSCTCAVLAE